MLTITEACRTLHVSRHTLGKWCKKLGIEPAKNELDGRFWELTEEQVETIRETLARRPGVQVMRPGAYSGRPIIPPALARPSVGHPGASQEASGVLLGVQVHRVPQPSQRPSQGKPNAEQARLAATPLPIGWVPSRRCVEQHGVDPRSVERQVENTEKGRGRVRWPEALIPESREEGDGWGSYSPSKGRSYEVTEAFRADQLPEVIQQLQERWPEVYHPCHDPACPCEK